MINQGVFCKEFILYSLVFKKRDSCSRGRGFKSYQIRDGYSMINLRLLFVTFITTTEQQCLL